MSEVQWRSSGLPVTEAKDITQSTLTLDADVVIVGSGAGGAVAGYELARRGKKVVILEAGPYVPSKDFTERFPESLETLYQDHGGQTNKSGDLLVLQGACVGGSTVVNGCVCFRTPDFILQDWQRDFGLSDLTAEELAPYFDRVEKNLSIEENKEHEIVRHGQLSPCWSAICPGPPPTVPVSTPTPASPKCWPTVAGRAACAPRSPATTAPRWRT